MLLGPETDVEGVGICGCTGSSLAFTAEGAVAGAVPPSENESESRLATASDCWLKWISITL